MTVCHGGSRTRDHTPGPHLSQEIDVVALLMLIEELARIGMTWYRGSKAEIEVPRGILSTARPRKENAVLALSC